LKDKDIVKATVDYPAVFSAVPFEVVLDLLAEIKKEQAQALQEIRKDLLESWNETRARVVLHDSLANNGSSMPVSIRGHILHMEQQNGFLQR
jgi:sugar-specific transcriptional regulator TrmB